MDFDFKLFEKPDFTKEHREILADLLKKQDKVGGKLELKIDRCEYLCLAMQGIDVVAIGAIKENTASDFREAKANVPELSEDFDYELGYLYTNPQYTRRKLASKIVGMLLSQYGPKNILASTEISANPGMVKILKENGFKEFGKTWKSSRHENYLGLFLRFV